MIYNSCSILYNKREQNVPTEMEQQTVVCRTEQYMEFSKEENNCTY